MINSLVITENTSHTVSVTLFHSPQVTDTPSLQEGGGEGPDAMTSLRGLPALRGMRR